MARASSDEVIVLGKRRRERLERIVARASSPQRLVLRAKIVLAAWRREANARSRVSAPPRSGGSSPRSTVKPHRVRGWLNRPADPAFHTKAQAVCRLYLDPPAGTELLRVDEKTCMQARSRKRATRPVRPSQPKRRELEYVRHGTASLLAAMNVTTGTAHPKIITRNDPDTFIQFLTELAQTVDPTLTLAGLRPIPTGMLGGRVGLGAPVGGI